MRRYQLNTRVITESRYDVRELIKSTFSSHYHIINPGYIVSVDNYIFYSLKLWDGALYRLSENSIITSSQMNHNRPAYIAVNSNEKYDIRMGTPIGFLHARINYVSHGLFKVNDKIVLAVLENDENRFQQLVLYIHDKNGTYIDNFIASHSERNLGNATYPHQIKAIMPDGNILFYLPDNDAFILADFPALRKILFN